MRRGGEGLQFWEKFKKWISKSLHKRGRITRKLASKMTIRGLQHSKDTIHIYLRPNLWSLFRPVLCKISKNETANDFSFPRNDRSGQFEDLRSIIFTDECLVYLSVPGNRKNDGVWAKDTSKVEPIQKSKFDSKIMVCGAMTASGVSKLHVLPPNQSMWAKYN